MCDKIPEIDIKFISVVTKAKTRKLKSAQNR